MTKGNRKNKTNAQSACRSDQSRCDTDDWSKATRTNEVGQGKLGRSFPTGHRPAPPRDTRAACISRQQWCLLVKVKIKAMGVPPHQSIDRFFIYQPPVPRVLFQFGLSNLKLLIGDSCHMSHFSPIGLISTRCRHVSLLTGVTLLLLLR